MAFIDALRAKKAEVETDAPDPWASILERVRGKPGNDGIERISTQAVFDLLDIPQRQRPGAYRRLARTMRELGWSPIRARGLTRGGFKDIVRGYARDAARQGYRNVTSGF